MKHSKLTIFIVCLLCAAGLSACATPAQTANSEADSAETTGNVSQAEAVENDTTAPETYGDPFAYCADAGTVDEPDERYTGPEVPEAIVDGVRVEAGLASDAPQEWVEQGTNWRCMDSRVYVCFVGANIPCWNKADTERTPTEAMTDFCAAQPDAEVIPAAVTGHETVYEWQCEDGQPEIVRQLTEIDEAGYQKTFWHELTPPSGS